MGAVKMVEVAETIRVGVLDPTLDAYAHNRVQADTLARLDTPEDDSVIERLRALRDVPVPGRRGCYLIAERQVDALERDAWLLVESNDREGRLERGAAGAAEVANAALYSTAGRMRLHPRELAAALRPVLAAIAGRPLRGRREPITDGERELAEIAWRSIAVQVPTDTLLGRGLAEELGIGHTATLHGLVEQLPEAASSKRGRRS